ncbi:MAG: serine/threonine-protein kinase [Phycisphaerales bacterium]|nr:serine/threonine-protein kinase [Phycisphaerales bacterium]
MPEKPVANLSGPIAEIGPYRLTSVLGEGGFGVVYLAERTTPFVQRVALKILKAGMDSAAVVARFDQERQALALMDHPGIARVLDGGLTGQDCSLGAGRPYFVMELVQGPSITEYCASRKLTLRARLELFMDVCEAVQHAHMKGIIHRDLKPSNILISETQSGPIPKVIDFGIAKAIAGSGGAFGAGGVGGAIQVTERGQFVGTPEYMSPEQADAKSDIDTRTDVYALGVLLYELLTGELPISQRELRDAGLAEILRIIREVEPPKPSTKLSSIAAIRTDTARQTTDRPASKTTAASSARDLRGDLDWIVMRAIEKARARRYDSPGSLSADIRRHLRSEPVEAGPPSATYRLTKFASRHRVLVAAGVISAIALCAGLVVALVGLTEATMARDRLAIAREEAVGARVAAERARDNERQQRLRAEAAAGFVQKAIETANPWLEPSSMTVPDLLDSMSGLVKDSALKDDPEMLAEVRVMIGGCYVAMGRPRDAEPHLRAAIASQQPTGGTPTPLTPVMIRASLYLASSLNGMGRAQEALLVLDALEPLTTAPSTGPERATAGEIAFERGRSHLLLAQREDAERFLKLSIDEYEAAGPERELEVASGFSALGVLYADWAGRQNEAADAAKKAVDIRRAKTSPNSPLTQNALHNLGRAQQEVGRFQDAIESYRAAIDAHAARGGAPNAALALSQNNLALLYRELGKPDDALRLAQQALTTRIALDPKSIEVAEILDLLAGLRVDRGTAADLESAVDLYTQELAIVDKPEPNLARHASRALTGLAGALVKLGRHDEAVNHARRAVQIREQYFAAGDWRTDSSRSVLGAALVGGGQVDEGEKLLIQSAEAALRIGTLSPSKKAAFVQRVVDFYEKTGKADEAEKWRARLPSLP